MPARKRNATEAVEPPPTNRRRSGRVLSTPKKSNYFEASDDEEEDRPPPKKRGRPSISKSKAVEKHEDESEYDYEIKDDDEDDPDVEEEEDDDEDDEDGGDAGDDSADDEHARPRVKITPLVKMRDTGGVEYEDKKLHNNTLLFLKDLKANNVRAWLKGKSELIRSGTLALLGNGTSLTTQKGDKLTRIPFLQHTMKSTDEP